VKRRRRDPWLEGALYGAMISAVVFVVLMKIMGR